MSRAASHQHVWTKAINDCGTELALTPKLYWRGEGRGAQKVTIRARVQVQLPWTLMNLQSWLPALPRSSQSMHRGSPGEATMPSERGSPTQLCPRTYHTFFWKTGALAGRILLQNYSANQPTQGLVGIHTCPWHSSLQKPSLEWAWKAGRVHRTLEIRSWDNKTAIIACQTRLQKYFCLLFTKARSGQCCPPM